jgi:hypothetical protein
MHPGIDDGESTQWLNTVIPYFEQNDLSDSGNFQQASELVNIPNLIDYFIIETYALNRDWPIFNMRWWSDLSSEVHDKWKYILYDLDTSFELPYSNEIWLGAYFNNTENVSQDLKGGYFIFNQLMKNDQFRIGFLERYLYFIDEVFTEQAVNASFDGLVKQIGNEYDNHAKRWDSQNKQAWLSRIDGLKEFNKQRQAWLRPKIVEWLATED